MIDNLGTTPNNIIQIILLWIIYYFYKTKHSPFTFNQMKVDDVPLVSCIKLCLF